MTRWLALSAHAAVTRGALGEPMRLSQLPPSYLDENLPECSERPLENTCSRMELRHCSRDEPQASLKPWAILAYVSQSFRGQRHPVPEEEVTTGPKALDYLVGGLRITLSPNSSTPGPRSHIVNFTKSLERVGVRTQVFLASELPLLRALSRAPEGGGAARSRAQVFIADLVRISAAIISGLAVRIRMNSSDADIIFERAAVMQSLSSFHPRRKVAARVVESNGIMSIETAADRNALVLTSLARIIERHTYRNADLVVTVSKALADRVRDFADVDESRLLVIPNAIPRDISELRPPARPSGFIVGFAGAIVPWQRLDRLIQGVAIAVENGIEVSVQIVGEGSEQDRLQTMVRTFGLQTAFDFTGRLSREATLELMSTWAVGYAGHTAAEHSTMYHSPLKVYEYAGLGLGIIATDYDDARQLERDGARVAFVSTPHDVAEAVAQLRHDYDLAKIPDRTLAKSLILEHSWEGRVRDILRHLAKGPVDPNSGEGPTR